jgi:hypothetical protein
MKQLITIGLMALCLVGCQGTKNAYKAADNLNEVAYVVAEHYYALLSEANRMKESGELAGTQLAQVQQSVRVTRPVIDELTAAAQNWTAVGNAQTEAELQQALDKALLQLSKLIDQIKAIRRQNAQLFPAIESMDIIALFQTPILSVDRRS